MVSGKKQSRCLNVRSSSTRKTRTCEQTWGLAYRNIGMADRALAEYRTALEHDPGHLNARYNIRSFMARIKKNYREAIRIWEDLQKVAPNYPQAEQMRSMMMTFKKTLRKDVR
jgi:tetratricopeptide (TPR) repeat protein